MGDFIGDHSQLVIEKSQLVGRQRELLKIKKHVDTDEGEGYRGKRRGWIAVLQGNPGDPVPWRTSMLSARLGRPEKGLANPGGIE